MSVCFTALNNLFTASYFSNLRVLSFFFPPCTLLLPAIYFLNFGIMWFCFPPFTRLLTAPDFSTFRFMSFCFPSLTTSTSTAPNANSSGTFGIMFLATRQFDTRTTITSVTTRRNKHDQAKHTDVRICDSCTCS